jgi:hypothetical protein
LWNSQKQHFGLGSGQKNRGLQDLYPCPSSKVRGWVWFGPGPSWAKNA